MSVAIAGGNITFTFTESSLFDKVQEQTTRVSQTIFNKENGNPMIDQYAISEDENTFVINKMKEAARNVFGNFSKLTYGVTNAISITDSSVILKVKDNAKYNSNSPEQINDLIEQALVYYIVSAWFASKGLGDISNNFYVLYSNSVRSATENSYQLRNV